MTSRIRTSGSGRRRMRPSSRTSRPRTPIPRRARRTSRGFADGSSTRSRGGRSRRTSRCRLATAAGGTTAARSRASSTGSTAARPSRREDDWTPPELSPDVPVPGEQVLLDGNVEAEGHEFFSLGSFEVSNDGRLMLYGVDVAGDERYTVRVRDLVTGEQLPDEIPGHLRRRHLLARRPIHRLHDRG